MALFHPKARQWIAGRKNLLPQLSEKIDPARPVIWMHCASLGEFEQGRPVLEQLRQSYPQYQIVLSFFSPSGYEIRKEYPQADLVTYLPLDTPRNARRWVAALQPKVAIFVKYEFWYHYMQALQNTDCTKLLIAASFRPSQPFFQVYGAFFRKTLRAFDHLFVQEKKDQQLLQQIKSPPVSVAGDPRIDRVLQLAKEARSFPLIEQFARHHSVLVLGSSWPPEEEILADYLRNQPESTWKIIIAPHDIREGHLRAIEKTLPIPCLRYSQATLEEVRAARILLIDNIGMLSALYRYGRVAFIGGGFGAGIHNTLEPIAFGLPVLFGPRYQKFAEARALLASGGAFRVLDGIGLGEYLSVLENKAAYEEASTQAKNYLHQHRGATQQILNFLESVL